MKFLVVTKVPEEGGLGNMAVAPDVWVETEQPTQENGWEGASVRLGDFVGNPTIILALRRPVFDLGEVLIVDDSGREIVGRGRKADKWDVTVESFDSIDEAVARAREVEEE